MNAMIPFLAENFPTTPAQMQFFVWLFLAITAVLASVHYAVQIRAAFRRSPSIDEEFARKEYVDGEIGRLDEKIVGLEKTISDKLSDNRSNNDSKFGELTGQIGSLNQSFNSLSNDLMRAIGRLEGKNDAS